MNIEQELISVSNKTMILKELSYNLIKSCIIRWIQITEMTNNPNIKIKINYNLKKILPLIDSTDNNFLLSESNHNGNKQIEFINSETDNTDCYYTLLYHIINSTFNDNFEPTIDLEDFKKSIKDKYLNTDNYADNFLNMIDLIYSKDNLSYCKYKQNDKIIGLSLQITDASKNIILYTTILDIRSEQDILADIYKTHNLEDFCIHNPHHLHESSIDYDNTDFVSISEKSKISEYQDLINGYIENAPIKCYIKQKK